MFLHSGPRLIPSLVPKVSKTPNTYPEQWFSTRSHFATTPHSLRTLAISGDIFNCPNWGEGSDTMA